MSRECQHGSLTDICPECAPKGDTRTPSERFKVAKVVRYDHGGGRVYVDGQDWPRELIADLYREDMREFVVTACTVHADLVNAVKALMDVASIALQGKVENAHEAMRLLDQARAVLAKVSS